MLLGTLGAGLLGSLLSGKGAIAKSQGQRTVRAGYWAKTADYELKIIDFNLSFNKLWNKTVLSKWT